MRSNQPGLKFRLKSWSNRLLINFCNPKSSAYLIQIIATIQIWTLNYNLNSNMIKKLNLIKNGWKRLDFQLISTFSIEFNHFRLNNWHQDNHFWSFDWKMIKKIKIDRLKSKLDQNYMKIVIIDMIWSLKYESDQNRRSNLAGLESEWSTIQF